MPLTNKNGNILDSSANIICHQVNCQGVMGRGLAKQIRERYPEVFRSYKAECGRTTVKSDLLGEIQLVLCDDGRIIVNMFAQEHYGADGKCYTDYEAFRQCLSRLYYWLGPEDVVAFPHGIGCGLGGGDWDVILCMIEEELGQHNVEIWKLR